MDAISVRAARRADASRFLDLVEGLASYERLKPPSAAARKRLVRDALGPHPRMKVLLAIHGGRPVGYAILLELYSSFLARPTLWIEDVFVAPVLRRHGIGRSLLKAIAAEARRRGCHRIEGVVLAWNKPAQAFYRRTGGTVIEGWWLLRYDAAGIQRLSRSASRSVKAP